MQTPRSRLAPAIGCLALLVVGCSARVGAPDLGGLYDRAAREHDLERNPVIVIPGILGSKLVDDASGRTVWGAFAGDYANPETPGGARLLALPMGEGAPLRDLRDDVHSAGALDRLRINLFGLPLELNAYVSILGTLGVGGYRDEGLAIAGAVDYGDDHYTCFQFDYDWRRDNVENAARLHEFILEKREYVRRELARRTGVDKADVKFDIVAHSMGGLISRYFLQYGAADLPADGSLPDVTWEGARYVDRLIMVGTPNAGSARSLVQLVEGADLAPILPAYSPALLGTMPSIYELLPRPRHAAVVERGAAPRPLDIYDPALWIEMGWGLAAADADRDLAVLLPHVPGAPARRAVALDHLRKCLARAKQFAAALDRPVESRPPTQIYLVAGDARPTLERIEVDRATGALRKAAEGPGDGTVLRSSALLDERAGGPWRRTLDSPIPWHHTMFLFTDHLGLTRDPVFTDNLLHLLLERP